jgi:hypothetical protein
LAMRFCSHSWRRVLSSLEPQASPVFLQKERLVRAARHGLKPA